MALLAIQQIVATGLTPSYGAAAVSDTIPDDGSQNTFLHYKNTGTQKALTIVPNETTKSVPGAGLITVPTMAVTIPATTGDKMVGPFPSAYINGSGLVTATLDVATAVTVAALKLTPPVS